MLLKLKEITKKRRSNAKLLDIGLDNIKNIKIPERVKDLYEVFHLYCMRVKNRDNLIKFLHSKGIDAKIHYPNPIHLQPAAKAYGYKKGVFPMAERASSKTMSLPVHEYIKKNDLDKMIFEIKNFYKK